MTRQGLTPKQSLELDNLKKHARKRAMFVATKYFAMVFTMCAGIIALNQFTIQSDVFVILGAFVSGVLAMNYLGSNMRHEQAELRSAAAKILENRD